MVPKLLDFPEAQGPLSVEQLSPNCYLIRCLKDPAKRLGKFLWVCNLVTEGTTGYVKGLLGHREPRLSELHLLVKIGMALGLESGQWEHLDDDGNLIVEKQIWRRRT